MKPTRIMICILSVSGDKEPVQLTHWWGNTPVVEDYQRIHIEYLEKLPKKQPEKKSITLNVVPRRIFINGEYMGDKLWDDFCYRSEALWDIAQVFISVNYSLGWR